MKDGLPGIAAVIDDQSVAAFIKPAFFPERLCDKEQMPNKLPIDLFNTMDIPDMIFWHDQDMRWRLRIDVLECDGVVIFMDQFGGNLFLDDLAEDAVRIVNHVTSSSLPVQSS